MKNDKRRWWIAGLLSYLVPGLGQVYNSQATKGLLFNFIFTLWGGVIFSIIFHILKYSVTALNIFLLFFVFLISFTLHVYIIFESIKTSRKLKGHFQLKVYNKLYIYLLVIILSLVVDHTVSTAIKENIIKPYRIPTASMEPTILAGDFLLSNQLYYRTNNPARGDIVTFRHPMNEKTYYIKRIIGMPGDTLEIANRAVYINSEKLSESYIQYMASEIQSSDFSGWDNFGPMAIPQGEYFMMGDNRHNSIDSRSWGTIKRHLIIGNVAFIYWSWDGKVPLWKIFNKIFSTRLSRIGKIVQ